MDILYSVIWSIELLMLTLYLSLIAYIWICCRLSEGLGAANTGPWKTILSGRVSDVASLFLNSF